MKNYSKNCLLLMILVVANFTIILSKEILSYKCDPITERSLQRMINKRSSEGTGNIYSWIDNLKVVLFAADNLIKEGLATGIENGNIRNWNGLLTCSINYLNKQKIPTGYIEFVDSIEKINYFTLANIQDLHEKFAKEFNTREKLSNVRRKYLENVKNQVEKNITKIINIFNKTYLSLIMESKLISEDWKKLASQDLNSIFKNYETFFKTYESWKNSLISQKKQVTDDLIDRYLLTSNILSKGMQSVIALFNTLLRFNYKLQFDIEKQREKVKKTWIFKGTEEKKLQQLLNYQEDSNEITHALLVNYLTHHIPKEFTDIIDKSKDPATTILFGFSGSLYDVLNSFLRNIQELLFKK